MCVCVRSARLAADEASIQLTARYAATRARLTPCPVLEPCCTQLRLLVYLESMAFMQVRQALSMPSTSVAVPPDATPASDEVPHIVSEDVEGESS